MTREIKNVFVNGISLVSKNETPAVEQAGTGFALFKTKQKSDIQKVCSDIQENLSKKEDFSEELREISKNIKKSFSGT